MGGFGGGKWISELVSVLEKERSTISPGDEARPKDCRVVILLFGVVLEIFR
jgi:hypothetical protein